MMTFFKAAILCCFLLGTLMASALDCSRATTPIDKTLCHQPDLTRLDAALNRLYASLRPQLTAKAQTQLLAQQRAWLAERDHACATGDADCLRKRYWARMDDFQALSAAAQVSDGKLDDATPVVVKGAWKAAAVQDSLGGGHASAADVQQSLSHADLPALGALVHATPGQICVTPGGCDTIGWTRTTMMKIFGGDVIGPSLGLRLTAKVLMGNNGAKQSQQLTLVPRDDGSVWAIFGLCEPYAHHCRNAAEVWTPLGPNTTLGQHP